MHYEQQPQDAAPPLTDERIAQIVNESRLESPWLYRACWVTIIATITLSIIVGPAGCTGMSVLP